MPPTRIAVWQGHSPAGDTAAGIAALRPGLIAAGAMGAATLVVPEVWLPGYNQPDIAAKALSGPLDEVQSLCRDTGCGLVLGFAQVPEVFAEGLLLFVQFAALFFKFCQLGALVFIKGSVA